MDNPVIAQRSVRPHAALQFMVFIIVMVIAAGAIWYVQGRRQLVCAGAAEASWRLAYVDGPGVSKFMWSIDPMAPDRFVDCLEQVGYDVTTDKQTGLIQAENQQGTTIANSIGDGYVDQKTFYKW